MENKTYIQKKVELYDERCLTPLFGNGKVKENLLEGLARTLEEETSSRLDFAEIDEYTGNIRVGNVLRTMNITTYEDLSNLNFNDLLKFRGFGKKSSERLRNYLKWKNSLIKEKKAPEIDFEELEIKYAKQCPIESGLKEIGLVDMLKAMTSNKESYRKLKSYLAGELGL